jgi:hypothetical protein
VKGSTSYRVVADHLGTPRLLVNSTTGAVAQRLDLDEWGQVTADSSAGFQVFGFAGGIYDFGADTGLVRFGAINATDYDPGRGETRWTAKDPNARAIASGICRETVCKGAPRAPVPSLHHQLGQSIFSSCDRTGARSISSVRGSQRRGQCPVTASWPCTRSRAAVRT